MPMTGEARREYQRKWIRARRDAWLEGKSCVKCGSLESLEIDHIDPLTKKYNPGRIWSWAESRRLEEPNKCQVLCSSCHKEKTSAARLTDHGTLARYNHRKCRCGPCKAAKARDHQKRKHPELVE